MSQYWTAVIEATQALLETIPWRTFAKRRKQGPRTQGLERTPRLPATALPGETKVTAVLKALKTSVFRCAFIRAFRCAFTRANTGQEAQLKNAAEGRHYRQLRNDLALQKTVLVSAVALRLAGQILCRMWHWTIADNWSRPWLLWTPTCRVLVLLKHRFSSPINATLNAVKSSKRPTSAFLKGCTNVTSGITNTKQDFHQCAPEAVLQITLTSICHSTWRTQQEEQPHMQSSCNRNSITCIPPTFLECIDLLLH